MEDDVATGDCGFDRARIGDVTLCLLDAQRVQSGMAPARHAANAIASRHEQADNGAAQKAAAAGHQGVHQKAP